MNYQEYERTQESMQVQPDMPMKWYKFMVYFAMPLAILANIVDALTIKAGFYYESPEVTDKLYAQYPGLKVLDNVQAIICILLCVLILFTRYALKNYKSYGTSVFILYLIVVNAWSTIYSVISMVISESTTGAVILALIAGVVVSIVYIYCNYIYFDNRKHLFVN